MTPAALNIRERLVAATAAQFPTLGTIRKSQLFQVEERSVPVFSIYLFRERMQNNDAYMQGAPFFPANDVDIIFQYVNRYADGDGQNMEAFILETEQKVSSVVNHCLTNNALMRFGGQLDIAGVRAIDFQGTYPREAGTLMFECRAQVTFVCETTFHPVITDDLRGVDVLARPVQGDETLPDFGDDPTATDHNRIKINLEGP